MTKLFTFYNLSLNLRNMLLKSENLLLILGSRSLILLPFQFVHEIKLAIYFDSTNALDVIPYVLFFRKLIHYRSSPGYLN
jgi:hypothetical protein